MISSIGHNTGPESAVIQPQVSSPPKPDMVTSHHTLSDEAWARRAAVRARTLSSESDLRRRERGRGQRLHRLGPLARRSVVTVCPDLREWRIMYIAEGVACSRLQVSYA